MHVPLLVQIRVWWYKHDFCASLFHACMLAVTPYFSQIEPIIDSSCLGRERGLMSAAHLEDVECDPGWPDRQTVNLR